MFRIVAIETLNRPEQLYAVTDEMSDYQKKAVEIRCARYDSIMKVLKQNQTYWFYQGYNKNEAGVYSRAKKTISDSFFKSGRTYISISSIVAENGMGKSSLLELYFRLVNNVSYALRNGLPTQRDYLCFVRDIYARLVFETDESFYVIEQQDGIVSFSKQNDDSLDWRYDFDNPKELKSETDAKVFLSNLFYTIVVNYSQYAYNTSDYIAEWDDFSQDGIESNDNQCWISSLFHKNDAYQTPIVLNPFRERGNININVERELTHSRLFQLVMTYPELLGKVLRNKRAKSFVFDIEDDLNPVPNHRYSSRRVLRIMTQMHLIESTRRSFSSNDVNNIGRRITAAWGHALGYYIEPIASEDYWKDMDVVRTINYIIYKTLKISTIYSKYYKYKECFVDKKKVQDYINELNCDNSHITAKLRKCLAYLNFKHYSTGHLEKGRIIGNEIPFGVFNDIVQDCIDRTDFVFKKLCDEQKTVLLGSTDYSPHYWLLDDLLPAPSFRSDILLEDNEGHPIRFSSLSSGEKQMIYSLSTVMYQLSNINSVWSNGDISTVKYRNVNLAFDEIELYSHPKYQLMLVDMLLTSVEALELSGVVNINVMIATHSPFILSDIPSDNILKLQDGLPYNEKSEYNSFCANVYSILNSQFFMDRSVGDFANSYLIDLAKKIAEYGKKPDDAVKATISGKIAMIGDAFVRDVYMNKLNSYDTVKV